MDRSGCKVLKAAGFSLKDQEQIDQSSTWDHGSRFVLGESVRPAAKDASGFPLAQAKPLPDGADLVRIKRNASHLLP